MPFPSGTPVVTLTGSLPSAVAGTPFAGRIVLTPSAELVDSTRHAIYPGGGAQEFDTAGTFAVQVIPNNAAGIAPTGWRWQIDLQPTGGRRVTFWADIHGNSGDTIQLDSLIPVSAPGGGTSTTGTAGPAGASAYQVAVTNGFSGTVTQWLASLVGATGTTGPQPPLGAAGAGDTIALKSTDPTTTNARTPTAHKASHATGGTDALTPADIGAYTAAAGADLDNLRPDLPAEQGLLAWTYDPNMAGHVTAQSNAGVAGRITLVRLIIRKQITWSNIWIGLAGVDAGAVLSNCYLGVYDSSGNLKGTTADISSSLMSGATAKPLTLVTPFTAAPGTYYVALLLNGTWATNSLTLKSSGAGISVNAGLTVPNLRYSNILTGQTSLPTTLALASQATSIVNTGWGSQWYGVS